MNGILKLCFCIDQILEYTPEEHPDYQNLKDALAKAEELCQQVNESVREKENSDRLEWMQNHIQCDGLVEVWPQLNLLNLYIDESVIHENKLQPFQDGLIMIIIIIIDFILRGWCSGQ